MVCSILFLVKNLYNDVYFEECVSSKMERLLHEVEINFFFF